MYLPTPWGLLTLALINMLRTTQTISHWRNPGIFNFSFCCNTLTALLELLIGAQANAKLGAAYEFASCLEALTFPKSSHKRRRLPDKKG